ncbi:MAG TPA: YceI family protein [Thermomicrobiales bacterium]|nr:YceI family protein [Thermomicrobiales bacterium]
MNTATTTTAGSTAVGTSWTIDSAHSSIEFSVRHMMIATVKGAFPDVDGSIHWDGEHVENAAVEVRIDTRSITTHNALRDDDLRSEHFFAVEQWPTMTFTSTHVEPTGRDQFTVTGDLTIRDQTRPVVLAVEYQGQITDTGGKQRAAFSATTSLSRKDFGISWNERLDGGGVVVGDTIKVMLDIAAVRQG